MARVQFSPLITSISGTVNNSTFQRNAFGNTLRGKPLPISKYSPARQRIKSAISYLTKHWVSMPQYKRDLFNSFTKTYNIKTRRNKNFTMSGFNYFIQSNLPRYLLFGFIEDNAYYSNPTFVPASVSVKSDASSLLIDLGVNPGSYDAFGICYISAAKPNVYTSVPSRLPLMFNAPLTSQQTDISTPYSEIFGKIPAPSNYVFVYIDFMLTDYPVFCNFISICCQIQSL